MCPPMMTEAMRLLITILEDTVHQYIMMTVGTEHRHITIQEVTAMQNQFTTTKVATVVTFIMKEAIPRILDTLQPDTLARTVTRRRTSSAST